MSISNLFWRASPEELEKGFIREGGNYLCLFCGEIIERGIADSGEAVSSAREKRIREHVAEMHGSVFAVLREIADKLQGDRIYSEKEVNRILKSVNDDYVTVRRYLIEYGYLDRKPDGSQYWRKK
ncbi:MAG: DUF2087 domain-containing protein [Peptococcaceae bacterium]